MEYKIIDGKIMTRALECHVVDHCNLRCNHCCSFSPLLKKWEVGPSQFIADLKAIGRIIKPQFVKIVGGEPLLHPNLEELLWLAKESSVSKRLSLTTNGHLMNKLSPKSWDALDMLTVSLYPHPELAKSTIKYIAKEAKARSIEVSWKVQDKFTCLDRDERANEEEARRVFETCWIRHRCHSIKNGRFYCCTRPQYIQKLGSSPTAFLEDGILLEETNEDALRKNIKVHLESSTPLNSCFICNGGHAPLVANQQLGNQELKNKKALLKVLCDQS